MNDRMTVGLSVAASIVVLFALGFFLMEFVDPPRVPTKTEDLAPAAQNQDMAELTRQMTQLAKQVGNLADATGRAPSSGSGSVAIPAALMHTPTEPRDGELLVVWAEHDLPVNDPTSSDWNDAPPLVVSLQAQQQAMPTLETATVDSVEIRALTDGQQIAWKVTWDDPTANYHLDADLFCDAVALQFPLEANAAYTMGAEGYAVQIIQWKAIWQKDVDDGFQDVQDLHPNYWADLYWFAEGEFPYRVPDAFQSTESRDYFIGYRAGNPMADLYRKIPVQEMISEGFGTLTHQPDSVTVGRGEYDNGRWSVVFSRPMATNDEADYQFKPGTRDLIALAVWEGGVENVGGRKHHSQWVVFEVQQ